jgi:hypothetical protein
MRIRNVFFASAAFIGIWWLAAALIVWRSAPRPDLVSEQIARKARDVRRSGNAGQLAPTTRHWWRKIRRQLDREPYPLDDRSRVPVVVPGEGLQCPEIELETYRGETLDYARPVQVNRHFKVYLARFEEVAARVGREVYGRPPSRIVHFGTYSCRTIRPRNTKLSEHAFGNAIDVAGFEFDALPERKGELGEAAQSFEVSVLLDWEFSRRSHRKHAVFLRSLAQELERDRLFRGAIVPPAPGHDDHFHLDMGWWSYFNGDPSFDD